MMQRVLLVAGIWLTACGPQPEPATAPTPSPSAAPPEATSSSSAPVEAPAPAPETSNSPAPEAAPAAPSIHDLCFAMCDKVKAKCAKSNFESCRVNCSKYDPPPTGCDDVVRSALECARDAADLVCANVAPESCGKIFRQITACASGQKPATGTEPSSAGLPSGFARYENAAEGIHAPMPEGAAPGEANVIATAKLASGAVYTIRKLPRPEGKLNEKIFLKIGLNLFGRCGDKMKMQGMVEKAGRTSINYTTKCPDGTVEHGLFWATEKALFVASVHGSADSLGPAETFLYGFEAK